MGVFIKKSVNNSLLSVLRICIGMFFFLFSSIHQVLAQASGEPSLKNLKKTGAAVTEEVKKMQEKQAHDELMSYVYMIVGFSVVIAIAWISTVNARKRSKLETEAKLRFHANKKAHDHGHSHTLHKAKR